MSEIITLVTTSYKTELMIISSTGLSSLWNKHDKMWTVFMGLIIIAHWKELCSGHVIGIKHLLAIISFNIPWHLVFTFVQMNVFKIDIIRFGSHHGRRRLTERTGTCTSSFIIYRFPYQNLASHNSESEECWIITLGFGSFVMGQCSCVVLPLYCWLLTLRWRWMWI